MKKGNPPLGGIYGGFSESNRRLSPTKFSKILEEELERAKVDEKRRFSLLRLAQIFRYSLATLEDAEVEHSLSTRGNPYEFNLRVYWKGEKEEKLPDEKQTKLTDFI